MTQQDPIMKVLSMPPDPVAIMICETRGQSPWDTTTVQGFGMTRWQTVLLEVELLRALL